MMDSRHCCDATNDVMTTKSKIVFEHIVNLLGPNSWTYRPVLEAWVDFAAIENHPSTHKAAALARLLAWVPALAQSHLNPEASSGTQGTLAAGHWSPQILEHLTLTLQSLADMPGGFGDTHQTSELTVYKVVVRAWHPSVTTFALHAARDLLEAAFNDTQVDVSATIVRLQDLRHKHCLGPSTACIVDAADDRDIPAIRLNTGNLLQLGYGINQRRIWTAETDRTGAIAETISRDKDLTKSLLQACGVPVPIGQAVDSAAEAWEAAQELGVPVVVKPSDGNHGRGVFTNLSTQQEIEQAYNVAVQEGSGVLVERFVLGQEHRLLVVGGKLIAAAKGEYAQVTGDGVSSIETLIDTQLNADPRRGHEEDQPLNYVRLDSAAQLEITRQGYTPQTILPPGQRAVIQRNGNVAIDCTELVHPDVAALACTAARIVGLDIAGIDLVALDISKPLQQQGGAIVEVNAGPGLLMHLKPATGTPRQVGRDIVAHSFALGDMARVPVIGITGSQGKTMTGKLLFRLLTLHGWRCGLASSAGLFVDKRLLHSGDCANFENARRVLMNREVQTAIIENGAHQLLSEGLAYERCEVGIITQIDWAEDLDAYKIHSHAERVKVYRTQMDVILPKGMAVLNADDPHIVELARHCDGQITWLCLTGNAPLIKTHLEQGQRVVSLLDGKLALLEGTRQHVLCSIEAIGITKRGADMTQTYNALAAAAAAWALGLTPDLIHAGLLSFDPNTAVPQ
jgi:cyanophycin synthetase